MTELVIITLASIFWGWLWADPQARLLAPVRDPLHRWLYKRNSNPLFDWLHYHFTCPVCTGVDMGVAVSLMLVGWQGWHTVAVVLASAGLHKIYIDYITPRMVAV